MKPTSIALVDFAKTAGQASFQEYAQACAFPGLVELPPGYHAPGPFLCADTPRSEAESLRRQRFEALLPLVGRARVHVLVPCPLGKVRVGGPVADLRLPGARGAHAVLFAVQGVWRLQDQESGGGTRVEGARLPVGVPTPLRSGQEVELGGARALFLLPKHLHALARLALRPRSEQVQWPAQGLLLEDVLQAVRRSALPGPETGPYLLQVPVEAHEVSASQNDFTQARSEESLLALQRAEVHARVRLYSLGSRDTALVGRSEADDVSVSLADASVSRRHAQLVRDPQGNWQLVDLDSQNGTYLAGRRLPSGIRVPLSASQTLQFGGFRCVFLGSEELCNLLRFLLQRTRDPIRA